MGHIILQVSFHAAAAAPPLQDGLVQGPLDGAPPVPLNALQNWQLQWQQQMGHLQPFLANPPAAGRSSRPLGAIVPPGAVCA